MRLCKLILVVICLMSGVAGCELGKQDPSKLPNYKPVTDPANMPMMPKKPGDPMTSAPATSPKTP